MALDEKQILNIVGQELSDSSGGNENDFIEANRQASLATYLGQPDGKEVEGRSKVVSTDVADAIEWIMPEIVKAFTQNNDVVTFDATSSKDEKQAEMESRYVYDILMKDNNGFIVIHQFIKDALMQKNGFIKVFYEECFDEKVDVYTGILKEEMQMVLSDEGLELIEMSQVSGASPEEEAEYEAKIQQQQSLMQQAKQMQQQRIQPTPEQVQQFQQIQQPIEPIEPPVFDIKVKRIEDRSKISVVSVPPEEFRINRQHNSVDVSSSRFSAHVLLKTAGELVAAGYSKELVDGIPSATTDDSREYRFYMQDETVYNDGDQSIDPSLRQIEIAECYMEMDIDEDGIPEYVKITTAGGDNPDILLDVEPINGNPFISATAILMSHKLFGLSIYDRLKQIQEQKTTLWRNIFDNMYLQNNQRTVVVENQVNLDDLMVSRPGGIIRAKRLDSISPFTTPPLSGDAYKMMDYLDQVRASRAGVTPEGPVTDSMIGDRVGSEGVEKMMSQKEELVGLMIRVIAETGIKPLCYKIREEVVQHQDVAKEYKFRGEWVEVNPSTWGSRKHATVRVGTGSGNRKEQQAAISQIMLIQEKMMANPQQALVNESKLFKAIDDFARFAGMPGAEAYFIDPSSPEGKQTRDQKDKAAEDHQKQQQAMAQKEVEFKNKLADAETSKAQTAQANVQLKAQVDQGKNALVAQKQQMDVEVAMLKQQLAEAEAILKSDEQDEELRFKYWEAKRRFETQEKQIRASSKAAKDNNNDK